ncbi:MAG: sigma-54 dependent transcriptional regulator [Gemmataceae bacterium]|nr:sigma-54 dependent transcriptional regulator [Gemmataceae bacterium]MCI0737636.1 sigma-54 dependent transcriptional regulator [Gemmataceae bacterium]
MAGNRVVLAADDPTLAHVLKTHLEREWGAPAWTCSLAEASEQLDRDSDWLLVLAASGPDDMQVVQRLMQDINLQKLPPIVVLVDAVSHPDTIPIHLEDFVFRLLHWPQDAGQLTQLVREFGHGGMLVERGREQLEELLSRRLLALTPSLLPLVDRIALAAQHDVTVLLTGETGTGKTFLSRLIHEHSPRKEHRFLTVPCGALSANLVESELFGHVRGAFTGADRPKVGKFAAVGEGTLLLDEIDTLGLEQQATLLRVIETGEFEPVGSIETQRCHGRLIVASNLDLEEAVERGRFRPDLYFRLNVMSFHLPPLRERVQDIAYLARGMAARFNRKFDKSLFDIHPEAIAALEGYSWPGNLRQLENVLQHAVLVSSGAHILVEHLPPAVQHAAFAANGSEEVANASLHRQRDVIERNVIQRALMTHGFSRTRAADALGISRVTLYKKMKKYGLMKMPLTQV